MGCAAKDTASCSLAAHDFSANSVFGGYPDRVGVISVLKGNMYLKTALVEAANPEYFCWNFDQGMIPMDVMKDQLRTFGEKIMPHYM